MRAGSRRTTACLTFAVLFAAAVAVRAQAPFAVETFDAAWRIVRDSHFDPALNGIDWDGVRSELRPKAVAAQNPDALRDVIREMLGRLGQSHFAVIPGSATASRDSHEGSGSPGFDVRLADGELLVTEVDTPARESGPAVRPGWTVKAIDRARVADLLASLPQSLEPRLRRVEAWRIAQNRLRGPAGTTVTVTFDDGTGKPVTLVVERRPEEGQPITVGSLPPMFVRVDAERASTPGGGTAGVIRFNVWMAAVDAPFQNAVDKFRHADGIVIDLRGNPGGLAAMLMGISGHFLKERTSLGVMTTRERDLHFNANPRRVNARGERVEPYSGPVAILVDALTGSASECFAGGMQSLGRARVFGQPTMGQALPALFSKLPNGDVLIHAFGDFVTANGTRLEGRGVIPDQVVPLDRDALLAGRDQTLEAALRWIDEAAAEERASGGNQ